MKFFTVVLALLTVTSSFAAIASGDREIYQALVNIQPLALPTAFPITVYDKRVGRLDCRYTLNTQTGAEDYRCSLPDITNAQDQDIYDALVNVPGLAVPTHYPRVRHVKNVGHLNCLSEGNRQTKTENYNCKIIR